MTAAVAAHRRTVRAGDGLALAVADYPAAPEAAAIRPPLLCLPGLARTARDFADLAVRYAARGHRVICPDYRGRGRSAYDPRPANYRPETYLEDIRHILCALNLERVVVVGTSMGGLLAMAMSAAMPTRLAGAVLNDIGPELPDGGLARILDYIGRDPAFADWDEAVAALKRMMPDLNPGPGGTATEADWRGVAEATYVRGADGRLHPDWDVRIAEPLRRGRPIPDLWPLFRGLSAQPVLAIRGGASDILAPGTFARMAADHPGLRTLTLPGKGHAPTLDEPESLEAIDGLLADIAG